MGITFILRLDETTRHVVDLFGRFEQITITIKSKFEKYIFLSTNIFHSVFPIQIPPLPVLSKETNDASNEQLIINEKLHIFSFDHAAWRQMRTADVMETFKDFGPSYVEWLGECSCNVFFEDEFSAKRALKNISQEIPERKTEEEVAASSEIVVAIDGGAMVEGSDAIVVAPTTTEGDTDAMADTDVVVAEPAEEKPNLSALGWRFCKKPVRKIADDRYGRKGSTARFLVRFATSDDVLNDRDDVEGPAIPRDWSCDVVYNNKGSSRGADRRDERGRGDNARGRDEYEGGNTHNTKRSRRTEGGERNDRSRSRGRNDNRGDGGNRRYNNDRDDDTDYAAMSMAAKGYDDNNNNVGDDSQPRGLTSQLKSSRGGFSLEEIMAERKAKAEAAAATSKKSPVVQMSNADDNSDDDYDLNDEDMKGLGGVKAAFRWGERDDSD